MLIAVMSFYIPYGDILVSPAGYLLAPGTLHTNVQSVKESVAHWVLLTYYRYV